MSINNSKAPILVDLGTSLLTLVAGTAIGISAFGVLASFWLIICIGIGISLAFIAIGARLDNRPKELRKTWKVTLAILGFSALSLILLETAWG